MLETIKSSLAEKVRDIGKSIKENKSAYVLAGILLITPVATNSCATPEMMGIIGAGVGAATGPRGQSDGERFGRAVGGALIGSMIGSAIEQNQQPRRLNKYCTDCGRVYNPDVNFCPYDSNRLQWYR